MGYHKATEHSCIYPNLRRWMNENRVNRYELLERMGYVADGRSYYNIRDILTGRVLPKKDKIDLLIKVTGLTYEELFYQE